MTCLCDVHIDDATCRFVIAARLSSGCFDEPSRHETSRTGGRCVSPNEWQTRNRKAVA